MRRLRSITEAVKFLKEQDPDTSMTPYFIRCMIVDGKVPTIMAGKKYLVDIDQLLEYLEGELELSKKAETPAKRIIRPISEKLRA